MTPKEQELARAIGDLVFNEDQSQEAIKGLIAKARECYAEELQAERMVTFKLSQQIERQSSALVQCLKFAMGDPTIDAGKLAYQIKEALK